MAPSAAGEGGEGRPKARGASEWPSSLRQPTTPPHKWEPLVASPRTTSPLKQRETKPPRWEPLVATLRNTAGYAQAERNAALAEAAALREALANAETGAKLADSEAEAERRVLELRVRDAQTVAAANALDAVPLRNQAQHWEAEASKLRRGLTDTTAEVVALRESLTRVQTEKAHIQAEGAIALASMRKEVDLARQDDDVVIGVAAMRFRPAEHLL